MRAPKFEPELVRKPLSKKKIACSRIVARLERFFVCLVMAVQDGQSGEGSSRTWWWLGARTAAHSPQRKLRKIDEEEWSNLLQRTTPRLVLFHTRIVAGCAATPHVFDGKRLWRLILLGEGGFL